MHFSGMARCTTSARSAAPTASAPRSTRKAKSAAGARRRPRGAVRFSGIAGRCRTWAGWAGTSSRRAHAPARSAASFSTRAVRLRGSAPPPRVLSTRSCGTVGRCWTSAPAIPATPTVAGIAGAEVQHRPTVPQERVLSTRGGGADPRSLTARVENDATERARACARRDEVPAQPAPVLHRPAIPEKRTAPRGRRLAPAADLALRVERGAEAVGAAERAEVVHRAIPEKCMHAGGGGAGAHDLASSVHARSAAGAAVRKRAQILNGEGPGAAKGGRFWL